MVVSRTHTRTQAPRIPVFPIKLALLDESCGLWLGLQSLQDFVSLHLRMINPMACSMKVMVCFCVLPRLSVSDTAECCKKRKTTSTRYTFFVADAHETLSERDPLCSDQQLFDYNNVQEPSGVASVGSWHNKVNQVSEDKRRRSGVPQPVSTRQVSPKGVRPPIHHGGSWATASGAYHHVRG